MGDRTGVLGVRPLTRMLCRACSRVALKRKQRQGTPASWAHLMYLRGRRGQAGRGHRPAPRPPAGPCRYLARLAASGFVLSMATRLLCLRAASHVLTQRCHEPRVSWGAQGEQVTGQRGQGPGRGMGRDGQ